MDMINELLTPEEAQAKIDILQARVEDIASFLRNAKREYHAKRTIFSTVPALLKEKRAAHGRIVVLREYLEGGAK